MARSLPDQKFGVNRMSFFHTLNYSSCNEDGLTELRALDVKPGDHVCCITGSGDRVLHMLLGNPDRVSAFDLNPAQNYLLELKISAIRELNYASYAQFLGLQPSTESRWLVYQRLRSQLTPDAARWFDGHRKMVENGLIYAGRWECYFRLSSLHLRLLRGRKITRLFQFTDLAQQRQFLHDQWNTWGWRLMLRLSFNRLALPRFWQNR